MTKPKEAPVYNDEEEAAFLRDNIVGLEVTDFQNDHGGLDIVFGGIWLLRFSGGETEWYSRKAQ
jgi:hypothetical protein